MENTAVETQVRPRIDALRARIAASRASTDDRLSTFRQAQKTPEELVTAELRNSLVGGVTVSPDSGDMNPGAGLPNISTSPRYK